MHHDWEIEDGPDPRDEPCSFEDPCGSVWCDWCWSGVWDGPRFAEDSTDDPVGSGDQLVLPAADTASTSTAPAFKPLQSATQWNFATSFRSCVHTLDAVTLPGGTIVHASDHYSRQDRTRVADVAVYLDHAWRAQGFAFTIDWPDYGLPTSSMTDVLRVARFVHSAAQDGQVCEVACLGSHGRTGTFLAILALLDMENPDGVEAVAHIRRNHCHKAVETAEQEWYVRALAAVLTGKNIPKMGKGSKRKGRKVKSHKKAKQSISKGGTAMAVAEQQAKLQAFKRGSKRGGR